MNTYVKMGIAAILMMGVGAAVIIRNGGPARRVRPADSDAPIGVWPDRGRTDVCQPLRPAAIVELGSTTCIPCKMMKPVIEELTAEYAEDSM